MFQEDRFSLHRARFFVRTFPFLQVGAGVTQAGLAVMAVGLVVETVADQQKSQFKKKKPETFCDR